MTVSYNLDVSSVGSFTFLRLLGRWKGSIFKSVYWELLGWIISYYVIHVIYRYVLNENQQKYFENVSIHLDSRLVYIPLTFMLGFFVTIVIDRWRNVVKNMDFIEDCALSVSSLIRGHTDEIRLVRRSIIRYLVLSQVMVFRDISMKVRRRFPNLESLVDAGFVFQDELDAIKNFKLDYNKYWMPISWANQLICRTTYETEGHFTKKYIDGAPTMNNVLNTIKLYRSALDMMYKLDWVPIPIAYPQVVFLAVRVYFLICLFSRQFLIHADSSRYQTNLGFPVMTVLEFLFFVGWMKVAEALLNPLGEDDDDLECNWLIDKNIATGMAIVDAHHDFVPPVRLDMFADPSWKPVYSEQSAGEVPESRGGGSVANVELATENERVKMIHVEPPVEHIHKISDASSLRRKISTAFSYRGRSNSIQAQTLEIEQKLSSPGPNLTPSPRMWHVNAAIPERFPFANTHNLDRLEEENDSASIKDEDVNKRDDNNKTNHEVVLEIANLEKRRK